MISVPEALQIIKENLPAPRVTTVQLTEACGKILCADIISLEPSPRYTSSAMDGFGVKWKDVSCCSNERPTPLTLVGESQAGIPYQSILQNGQAIRISTGAIIPDGVDTVVRVEDTGENYEQVLIKKCKKKGQDIRHIGEEYEKGITLLEKGQIIGSREIALLAAMGINPIPVYDSPRITLCITGTELAHHWNREIEDHQVRDSNAPMLISSVTENGGEVTECFHVDDDLDLTVQTMGNALENECDIILCSGGVSVGQHDHIKNAAEKIGFKQLFWKICQKPGKPLFVAKKKNTLLFGLPGNPVSAFMCFQNFIHPVLASLQGIEMSKACIAATASVEIENPGSRTNFVRVQISTAPTTVPSFQPTPQQGSHMITSIVKADGYISMEPKSSISKGQLAEVILF
ncbi:MAG: molybdopterin molybdotransferase MoeA [Desulfotalea sp.]